MRWSEIITERLAQERVHHDPSFGTIKALMKDAVQRFVISKDGDLYVGNAFYFTHQQIFPTIMAVAVRGYFFYKNGKYLYRTMGPFDNLPCDYELLRTFEHAGIHEDESDAEIEESFTDKVSANIKAKIKIDKVTPQRGRSMPGSNPEKKLTRRKRFM
jgi:hypothetical protein